MEVEFGVENLAVLRVLGHLGRLNPRLALRLGVATAPERCGDDRDYHPEEDDRKQEFHRIPLL